MNAKGNPVSVSGFYSYSRAWATAPLLPSSNTFSPNRARGFVRLGLQLSIPSTVSSRSYIILRDLSYPPTHHTISFFFFLFFFTPRPFWSSLGQSRLTIRVAGYYLNKRREGSCGRSAHRWLQFVSAPVPCRQLNRQNSPPPSRQNKTSRHPVPRPLFRL